MKQAVFTKNGSNDNEFLQPKKNACAAFFCFLFFLQFSFCKKLQF